MRRPHIKADPGRSEDANVPQAASVIQRLGCLLDLHRIELPADVRAALVELTRGTSKIQLGPRARWGHAGKLMQP